MCAYRGSCSARAWYDRIPSDPTVTLFASRAGGVTVSWFRAKLRAMCMIDVVRLFRFSAQTTHSQTLISFFAQVLPLLLMRPLHAAEVIYTFAHVHTELTMTYNTLSFMFVCGACTLNGCRLNGGNMVSGCIRFVDSWPLRWKTCAVVCGYEYTGAFEGHFWLFVLFL